ncbi:PLP-dependent aminotransferase family protein [Actinomadura viridis]|uniref:GntR family transcriptional regulator/MocR family aminotransferase n=1 Tax=Actinomadura viridis TaxID=58110 RepID=A0A931GN90_9ACTN|nr:PLP-dependent aminotransferase family protein [Actinomadura viridis]MBG6092735.1 GntR family transcriptional regulator/MocR family aminotransferase [Actinomadura viridis]
MSGVNTGLVHDLLLGLERTGATPMHRQIETALRDGIRAGRLRTGTSLPSSRRLATELGVSRGVVVEAYNQLAAEGYLVSTPGSYTRVAAVTERPSPAPAPRSAPGVRLDFGYGRADAAGFPRAAWLRSLRRVLTGMPHDRLNYLDGYGVPELRAALADYLNRARGTSADAARVLITSGFGQAAALIIGVAARRGARRIAVEDPSSEDDVRSLARLHGLDVVGIPVTDEGLDTAALERCDADLLVITPSHQWPLGGVLPAEGRAAVIRWARARGAIVLEDDYDAEYRYDRAPIGAMQGLAPDVVVHAGSLSKTLAPGLRLGWLLLPPRLAESVAEAKLLADRGSPAIDQLAFADFLMRGEFDRHLRRMRPVYRRRRDALLAGLAEHLPGCEPVGAAAGLHLVIWLPEGLREEDVVAAAAGRGVRVTGVAPYRLNGHGRQGLILGYSDLNEGAIAEGVRALAAAMRGV